jgi:benzoyl-CoA reductase/2-hydroxyglutaryl-CoA dehydratase subunit BcrC/BadD/HgdB
LKGASVGSSSGASVGTGPPPCRTTGEAARAAFERLVRAGADPASYLRERRAAGASPAVGYVCGYVPEEVILAAGLHPVRVGGRPGPVGPADSRLQSFACSFARACLDGLLTLTGSEVAGVVFAYTCDSLRAAAESWRIHAPRDTFFHFLNLPARLEGRGVEDYTRAALSRFALSLEAVEGGRPVTGESLEAAARLTAAVRAGLGRLAEVRSARPDILPGSTFIAVARGATVLEREEAARDLDTLAADLEAAVEAGPLPDDRAGSRPRVLVTGGFLETEGPLRLIEEAGLDIVADDLCLGGRALAFGAGDGRALARLAALYLRRVPCPTKHPPERRFTFVCDEAARHGVDGVVFLLQKFCDPHAFDYPELRARLGSAGYPSLLLEVEQGALSRGQALTRLEAFAEGLRETVEGERAG